MRLPLLLLFVLLGADGAFGQGCSQCRESVGQTPLKTQQAYRRGIAVMVVAGAAVFAGTLVGVRKFR